MNTDKLEKIINKNFDKKEKISPKSDKKIITAINETIELVDSGKLELLIKLMDRGQSINGSKKLYF